MGTPYSIDNKAFSDKAHLAARQQVYPHIFKVGNGKIAYEEQGDISTPRWGVLDGELGIDRLVKVTVGGLRMPLTFTVQERFRNTGYKHKQDITVTEWNRTTNLPSELYKIAADLFLYGYFDANGNRFADAICINVPSLKQSIVNKLVHYSTEYNKRSNQDFLCFKFNDLHSAGLVIYRHDSIVPANRSITERIQEAFGRLSVFEKSALLVKLQGQLFQAVSKDNSIDQKIG